MIPPASPSDPVSLGFAGPHAENRYELLGEIATGGMATVYFGQQRGQLGFTRAVAIKSMHPQLAKDPTFRAMFVDEAHLTSRIRHANVVPTLDIVATPTRLLIIMEYVEGVSLSALIRAARERGKKLPVGVACAIARDMLEGLHAAHELTDERGVPLGVVHRDVSPQNILIGVDGVARVVDFGVAKAANRSYHTQTGEIRGKVGYMAPEHMFGEHVDRRVDVYASGVVLWEALVGERLFNAPTDAALVLLVMKGDTAAPSLVRGEHLPDGLDALIKRALDHSPDVRFATAADMAHQLSKVSPPASRGEVAAFLREVASAELKRRSAIRAQSERTLRLSGPSLTSSDPPPPMLEPEAQAVQDVLTRATMTLNADASPATGPTVTTPRPQRLGATLALGLVLFLLAGVGTAVTALQISKRRANRTGVAAQSEPAPTTSTASADPAASESASVSTAGLPSASVAPIGAAPSSVTSGRRRTGGSPTRGTASGKGRPDCTLPYTTDAEGHRHYRAECL